MVTEGYGLPCPCGSGTGYHLCCEPLHHGERHAETAEQLMRSRYSAYACGDADYLFRTWHPRTRPLDVEVEPSVVWRGLELLRVVDGGPGDDRGEVEFIATYDDANGPSSMREHSLFERRGGRWVYLDGTPQIE